jgi:Fe-S cluster biogenesis protein NfuA
MVALTASTHKPRRNNLKAAGSCDACAIADLSIAKGVKKALPALCGELSRPSDASQFRS